MRLINLHSSQDDDIIVYVVVEDIEAIVQEEAETAIVMNSQNIYHVKEKANDIIRSIGSIRRPGDAGISIFSDR